MPISHCIVCKQTNEQKISEHIYLSSDQAVPIATRFVSHECAREQIHDVLKLVGKLTRVERLARRVVPYAHSTGAAADTMRQECERRPESLEALARRRSRCRCAIELLVGQQMESAQLELAAEQRQRELANSSPDQSI